jgi:hypothetical protein
MVGTPGRKIDTARPLSIAVRVRDLFHTKASALIRIAGGQVAATKELCSLEAIERSNNAAPHQILDHLLRQDVGATLARLQVQFGIFWRLIRRVDPGEVLDLAGQCAPIQALWIARDALFKRRIDEDFDEFAVFEQFANHGALGMKRRDERAQRDQAGLGHQFRHLANAADILDPVRFSETKILVQAVPDVIAVQQHGVRAAGMQMRFDHIGDRRLAGTRQTSEPEHCRPVTWTRPERCGLFLRDRAQPAVSYW